MTVLVGGVGELFQGDLDLGRIVVQALGDEPPRTGPRGQRVLVEELHYGAVAVAQRLQDLAPTTLVLVGAVARHRAPGAVERRWVEPPALSAQDLQVAIGDAVTGYISIDLVIEVACALGVLPPRTIAIEVEPGVTSPGATLSSAASSALGAVLAQVRAEVGRASLLDLAEELRPLCDQERLGPSPSLTAMLLLLEELTKLERDGRWGRAFLRRDRLRSAIADTTSSEGMDHRDWGLWWTLIEELDRVQSVESTSTHHPRPV